MFPRNNITEYNIGGRLIPKQLLETDSTALLDALKFIIAEGGLCPETLWTCQAFRSVSRIP